jgi:hypothetical protein
MTAKPRVEFTSLLGVGSASRNSLQVTRVLWMARLCHALISLLGVTLLARLRNKAASLVNILLTPTRSRLTLLHLPSYCNLWRSSSCQLDQRVLKAGNKSLKSSKLWKDQSSWATAYPLKTTPCHSHTLNCNGE